MSRDEREWTLSFESLDDGQHYDVVASGPSLHDAVVVVPKTAFESVEAERNEAAQEREDLLAEISQAEAQLEQAREELANVQTMQEAERGTTRKMLHRKREAEAQRDALAEALREMMGSYTSLVQLAKHNPDRLVREVFTGDPMMWDGPVCARSALTALEPKPLSEPLDREER